MMQYQDYQISDKLQASNVSQDYLTLHNYKYMIKQCYGKAHKQAEQVVLGLNQRTVFSHQSAW